MVNEMERVLVENTEDQYYNIKKNFTFSGKTFRSSVNFAYFNSQVDTILKKHRIKFDETWMMLKAFTQKNYKNYMDSIVTRLYEQNVDILVAQDVIMDMVTLTNKIVNLFNSGKKIDLDLSLVSIAQSAIKNPKIRDLMSDKHRINDKMTPEQIVAVRRWKINEFEKEYTPGITELLKSGYAIKQDQMVNIFGGIDLIPRIHEMDEMFPRAVDTKWLDGLRSKDQFFMAANINAYSLYMTKSVIEQSGVVNKTAAMIAQDCTIVEKDCGSVNYQEYAIEDMDDLKTLRFKYMLNPQGKLEEITLNHTHLIGQTVKVRSIFKCASKHGGVCETCFGASAKWNKSTKYYRKDLGVEFTKMEITPPSQDIMSTKHNTAPNLEEFEMGYKLLSDVDNPDIEETTITNVDDNEFYKREFNNIIWKKGVKVYLDKADCSNRLFESRKQKREKKKKKYQDTTDDTRFKPIEYIDNEFGEMDIIRASALIVEKDGVKYKLYPNSHFRISGFPRANFNLMGDPKVIKLKDKDNKVSHVIRNYAKAKKFFEIEKLYKLATPENMNKFVAESEDASIRDDDNNIIGTYEEFIERVIECFPKADKVALEIIFRNKIRDANDRHKLPDWTIENPEAVVLSDRRTVNAKPSLSLKISAGYIKQRVNNPFYHDIRNLENTSYDRIYHVSKEE